MGNRAAMTKTSAGNFFEDFSLGQKIVHATPRTVTTGDQALYTALYGPRFAVQSSDEFARAIGYPKSPIDDFLVFNIVFGKSVPDISLNAIANLGYAECVFLNAVYAGDTLSASSEVIGLKENSSGKTGTVYVRSRGANQHGEDVLSFVRWVMVRKRDEKSAPPTAHVPELLKVAEIKLDMPRMNIARWNFARSGSPYRYGDYAIGERIDHLDGMTVEETEHQLATRLLRGRRLSTRLCYRNAMMWVPCALSRGPREICLAVNFRLKTERRKSRA
jgi:2-methylfumaryl-CoA hydratase